MQMTTPIAAPTARRTTGRLWWLYIAGGLAVMAAYFLVQGPASAHEQLAKVILYCSVSGSAAIAIGIGLGCHRPAHPLPWVLLLINQVVYFTADVSFYVRHDLLHLS